MTHVGFIAPADPRDVRSWSGVPHFAFKALSKHVDRLTYIDTGSLEWIPRLTTYARYSERLFGRRFVPGHFQPQLRRAARRAQASVGQHQFDAVVVMNSDSLLAYLDLDVPVVHNSDATFAAITGYYPEYSRLWGWSQRHGATLARKALSKATLCSFPSEWAAQSAAEDYGVPESKISVIPYGANLPEPPSRDLVLAKDPPACCQFLFIGRDWKRKGGQTAFEAMEILLSRGIDARMVAVGCEPTVTHERLRVIPFLNKQVPEDLETYLGLWRDSAFLFMPSHQETFGAIYSEAAANGLPVIARDTGGVSGCVESGVSGLLLPKAASAVEYADAIQALWSDRDAYHRLVVGARDRFESSLNWDAWATDIARLVRTAVGVGS